MSKYRTRPRKWRGDLFRISAIRAEGCEAVNRILKGQKKYLTKQ